MINTLETLEINQEFGRLASDQQITRTARALETNGVQTIVVETGDEAREYVLSLIPAGAQVYSPPSRTADQIGLRAAIESSVNFQSLASRIHSLDRVTQRGEIRKLISSPDIVIGSVHAITEMGEVLIASASGSQLSSVASGADKVIWVVGAQKLVSTLEEGFRRVREYSYPLENIRAQQVYGRPSAINKILIVNREILGRITIVLVKQNLGF
jgi:prefoldin subunit 5